MIYRSIIYAMYNNGLELHKKNKYEEEIFWYDKIMEIKVNFFGAPYMKGVALSHLGNFNEAIFWYDKALQINHDSKCRLAVSAVYKKGVALYELGSFDEAISCFNKALEVVPDNKIIVEAKNEIIKNWPIQRGGFHV